MPINTKNQKEDSRQLLIRQLAIPKKVRAIVLSYIKDPEILKFFHSACSAIWVVLITEIDNTAISGADIWITDIFDENIPLQSLAQQRVIPVVPFNWSKIYTEFDPMKFEGNAFLFESMNEFQMFEKLIRALENMRYAGDKRMLLQNVEKSF